MTAPASHPDLPALLSRVADGSLTPAEFERLDAILLADAAARAEYREHMRVHALLYWRWNQAKEGSAFRGQGSEFRGQEISQSQVPNQQAPHPSSFIPHRSEAPGPESLIPPIIVDDSPPGRSSLLTGYFVVGSWPFSYAAATLITAMMILGAWAYRVSHDSQFATLENRRGPTAPGVDATEEQVVGRITGMADCRCTNPQNAPVRRDVGSGQTFALSSGLMEITYTTGAKVILEGPCTYEVDSPVGGYLSLGKLTARVEKSESRKPKSEAPNPQSPIPNPLFSVRTPTAIVTDLGTEFGVEVDKFSATRSHVFCGKVELRVLGGGAGETTRLGENQSAQVEIRQGRVVTVIRQAACPSSFTRRMPRWLPNKLVSYWNLDEGAGTTAVNSGLGRATYNGILMSAGRPRPGPLPRWVAGKFGTALSFSGSTSANGMDCKANYLGIAGSGGLNDLNRLTISMWVKWNGRQPVTRLGSDWTFDICGAVLGRTNSDLSSWAGPLIGLNYPGDPARAPGLRLLTVDARGWHPGNEISADDNEENFGMPQNGEPFTPPGDGAWVHVLLTACPLNICTLQYTMYVNGVKLRTVNGPSQPDGGSMNHWSILTLGAMVGGGNFGPSNSTIDDVGVFNETLAEGKARAIYNAPRTAGLKNYDLGKLNALFGVFDSTAPDASAALGPLTWEKAAGLSGHNAGDAWLSGGTYYVQLDSSGNGVKATRESSVGMVLGSPPEPQKPARKEGASGK